MKKKIVLIGYSGHAYVVYNILRSNGNKVLGYCETEEVEFNPFNISFLGCEKSEHGIQILKEHDYFIAIGNNQVRNKIYRNIAENKVQKPINAIHPSAIISVDASLSSGIMISANCSINPLATLGLGVICNTGCIIEHECIIHDFAHIAPGATLTGNVTVGERSFIGANAVVKQGVIIGSDAVVGAGAVVIKDVLDGQTVAGNPARVLYHK